ncbi:MAG: pilus assembly protein PilM [Planctomycetes bacterium]|nr:pilus assembly protein PilM [Planctomycetota bacterium]
MIRLNNRKTCPIGVDLGSDYIQLAQIGITKEGPFLQSAGISQRPEQIELNSPAWQRWAIDIIKDICQRENFKGKEVVTALPANDLLIEPIKIPRSALDRLDQVIPQKMQKRLPFPAENALYQHVIVNNKDTSAAESDVLAIVADRETINRHLAIYEKVGLDIVGISIWPVAMIKSFTSFFCRRQNEQDKIAILLSIGIEHTNVVITRGPDLLFARVISIGHAQLEQGEMVQRLFSEIDACIRYFESSSGNHQIERLLFFTGSGVSGALCEKVAELAQRIQVPAQVGDVLSAIEINQGPECLVDRRNSRIDWATTFGLSLDGFK